MQDNKYEYRRDSSDNIHVVYSGNYNNKAFEGYVPPTYTENNLSSPPVPPPAPTANRKILGLRRRTFWIVIIIFAIVVLGVAVGAGVGIAAATKKHDRDATTFPNSDAEGNNATPTPTSVGPVTVTLAPTTFTTSVIPTPTPVPITHCQQMWEGTAPFCDGKCDGGWTGIKQQKLADDCDESTDTVIIDSCANLSGNSCWTGSKVLCQRCWTEGEDAPPQK